MMDKPFAITLDVGSSLANKTGSWRDRAPRVRAPPAALQPRLPGRREHPAVALPRRVRRLRGRLARAGQRTTRSRPSMGRVCYHPCETACNRGQLDESRRHPLRRALPRRRGDPAGLALRADAPRRRGKRVLVVGAGPPASPPPTTSRRRGHAVTIREAGPMAGGMMRFGIPRYRLPRDVLDAEIAAHPRPRRDARAATPRSPTSSTTMARRRLRRRLPGRRRAHRQARLHPGRRGRAHPRRGVAAARAWRARTPPLLGRRVVVYGGGNTAMDAARTAKRLGASEA